MSWMELILYSAILLILLGAILWRTWPNFQYYLRIVSFYGCLSMASLLAVPFMKYRPDPDNTKIVAWILRKICFWMDLEWEVRGFENINFDGPCIIISNHQSSIDILGIFHMLPPGLVPIIKKILAFTGPFGACAYFCGSVFIDRSKPSESKNKVNSAVQQVIDNKLKVLVYAEGTRYHGDGMLPFKKGGFHMAVQGKIPIVPIVFSSYRNFYSKPKRKFLTGGKCIITILPPISTTDKTGDDVTELTKSVQELMLPILQTTSKEADQTSRAQRHHQKEA